MFIVIFCSASVLFGQNSDPNLREYNQQRIQKTKTGMIILGSWAAANLLSSPVLAGRANGSDKYFHQMNGLWNLVNLGIAGAGYLSLAKEDLSALTLSQSVLEQQKIEKLLLFNTGLDVAYMLGGLYMIERSKNVTKNADRLKGFGKSVVLQGGFLFAFDLIFYLTMNNHGKGVLSLLSKVQLTPNSVGMVLKF